MLIVQTLYEQTTTYCCIIVLQQDYYRSAKRNWKGFGDFETIFRNSFESLSCIYLYFAILYLQNYKMKYKFNCSKLINVDQFSGC